MDVSELERDLFRRSRRLPPASPNPSVGKGVVFCGIGIISLIPGFYVGLVLGFGFLLGFFLVFF